MHILNVRFSEHLPLGKEVMPDNFVERGRRCGSSRVTDIQMYDSMFLKITFTNSDGDYSQFVPWARVATVYFDDSSTKKS
jgi:hypothetical protein